MLYDVRLALHYDYDGAVQGDRHLVRVMPTGIPGAQRVIAASLAFEPRPHSETTFVDFFGTLVTTIAYTRPHGSLDLALSVRIAVDRATPTADASADLAELRHDLARLWSVDGGSPHHFLAPSPRIVLTPEITAYARASLARTATVQAAASDLCTAIHRDFAYVTDATNVDTTPLEAFTQRQGVCQDFVHVMIAGLRGVGIPAAYVSGYLRTLPPAGGRRLEGTDAMHAWVRVWCGAAAGWVEFDPTNAMLAGPDHITIGYGRDYSDISPIVGMLRTSGRHRTRQAVDVTEVIA